jgi:hypothetical protein
MDIDKFLEMVRASKQHNYFYHFTDKRNLSSIRSTGILCTKELRKTGLFPSVFTGGDENSLESDKRNGTDEYVCLCFTKSHPMYFRANQRGLDLVYLPIDPRIIKSEGVKITDAASNQTGVEKRDADIALDNLHLDVVYQWIDWKIHPDAHDRRLLAEKYEILIPRKVAPEYIVGEI